jgi:hypothetical protein
MKRLYILSILLVAAVCNALAQAPSILNATPQGSVFYNSSPWQLWAGAGIAAPALPTHVEGHAQLNDTSGSAVVGPWFSTNGIRVYNSLGADITAGPLLLGNNQSTNSAQVVRLSGGKAMIITTQAWNSGTNLAHYTIVDISVPTSPVVLVGAGLRNAPITAPGISQFSEKSVIVPKLGTNNYWLILHEFLPGAAFSSRYVVFEINSSTATVNFSNSYSVGSAISSFGHKGQMRAIRSVVGNGFLVAAAHLENSNPAIGGNIDILDMNMLTGALSTREVVKLDANVGIRPYGLEFGEFGRFIYFNSFNNVRQISRLTVTVPAGSIWTTRITANPFWAPLRAFMQMQRMRGGTIYFPSFLTNRLNQLVGSDTPGAFAAFVAGGSALTGAGIFRIGISNYPCMQ